MEIACCAIHYCQLWIRRCHGGGWQDPWSIFSHLFSSRSPRWMAQTRASNPENLKIRLVMLWTLGCKSSVAPSITLPVPWRAVVSFLPVHESNCVAPSFSLGTCGMFHWHTLPANQTLSKDFCWQQKQVIYCGNDKVFKKELGNV